MSHLLTDDQMRRFVCDGYLLIDSGLPAETHAQVRQKLQWMLDEGYNPGINVLPRVPEMQAVLDSPAVAGALASVLGSDYVLHPCRYCHTTIGANDAASPGGTLGAFQFWHQDAHCMHIADLDYQTYRHQSQEDGRDRQNGYPGEEA